MVAYVYVAWEVSSLADVDCVGGKDTVVWMLAIDMCAWCCAPVFFQDDFADAKFVEHPFCSTFCMVRGDVLIEVTHDYDLVIFVQFGLYECLQVFVEGA